VGRALAASRGANQITWQREANKASCFSQENSSPGVLAVGAFSSARVALHSSEADTKHLSGTVASPLADRPPPPPHVALELGVIYRHTTAAANVFKPHA
jgi:hypothetical protein